MFWYGNHMHIGTNWKLGKCYNHSKYYCTVLWRIKSCCIVAVPFCGQFKEILSNINMKVPWCLTYRMVTRQSACTHWRLCCFHSAAPRLLLAQCDGDGYCNSIKQQQIKRSILTGQNTWAVRPRIFSYFQRNTRHITLDALSSSNECLEALLCLYIATLRITKLFW